jgi:hypothetical protein
MLYDNNYQLMTKKYIYSFFARRLLHILKKSNLWLKILKLVSLATLFFMSSRLSNSGSSIFLHLIQMTCG